jgi:putative DNA primase/helicase
MNAHTLAKALGGEACGNRISCPGPGHSAADRSLSVKLDPDAPEGFVVYSHADDDVIACRDHVRKAANLPAFRPEPRRPRRPEPRAGDDKRALALNLWREAHDNTLNTPVEVYLRSRGLSVTSDVFVADVLRFHPRCPFKLKSGQMVRLPAMLALMRAIGTNRPMAVHRTALKPDGSGKADLPDGSNPKKMLGPAKGAVIKLPADEDVTHGLALPEGIETALTAVCAGWRPVWASGTAGAIRRFPVLPGVEALTIFADPDPTGCKAARVCAERWAEADREAAVILPPSDDCDWNDIGRAA